MNDPAQPAPPVVAWYARYCQGALALFAVGSFFGIHILRIRADLAARWEVDPLVVAMFGGFWIATLLFLAFVHYAALKTPRSPWAWKIHAVVLAVGLTTLVLWPFALPLIWFWLKPETREFFGATRSEA